MTSQNICSTPKDSLWPVANCPEGFCFECGYWCQHHSCHGCEFDNHSGSCNHGYDCNVCKHANDCPGSTHFADLINRVIMQNQQMAAGCPADCEENSCSCDKDTEEMPPECKMNFMLSMEDPEDSWR